MHSNKGLGALNTLIRGLQAVLGLAGWLGAALILGLHLRSDLEPFLSMILAFGLVIAAVVVHEGGHYLGARLNAMPVLLMRVAAVEVQVQRRGWQARWSPQLKGRRLGGLVMAASNPQRPLRRQMLWMVVMGPLLNLLVGLACLGLGWSTQGLVSAVALAFAAINLSMALANLLPTLSGHASDGVVLIAWWLHRDDQRDELAQARLLALMVAGVPCEQLPAADIALLAQGPMPQPLMAIDYRLGALLNQGDWQAAGQLEQELEALLQTHAQSLTGMSTLITLLRIELGFVRACLQQDASCLWDDWMNRDLEWFAPWLRPRCEALRAFLQGDRQQGEAHLQRALQAAENSVVRSQYPSEAILAQYLRALPVASCGPA
ncbi:M50 family metallopeptidase [Pseudomonas sp. Fl4BN1]|uniref:M50 family metallopeptidase n=1 Tax=Pseudomonas sp. Fl4BN1 TaxID=2697651 RepID=UPI001377D81C|nr:M50 family metallopeptidase [Pseudomonas sp. Fl4BN1]NBF13442.1 hypothetical protein [Pseudomonas sp. Fl4BN1]